MFFEYAVWGAWAPVLAARLLGPLKMSGKQTGWIYTTLPIACIVSPLVAGQLADRYLNLEWILAGAHLIAAVLMFVAVRQKTFGGLFLTMLGWSLCYAATMPLVNSVLFRYDVDGDRAGKVFIWAPVAWALVGYSLSGWRVLRKAESDGSDALIFSAVLGLIMVGCCFLLPATPPKSEKSLVDALGMLRQGDFLLFIVASLCVAGTMQFYFLGSGQYMMDRGCQPNSRARQSQGPPDPSHVVLRPRVLQRARPPRTARAQQNDRSPRPCDLRIYVPVPDSRTAGRNRIFPGTTVASPVPCGAHWESSGLPRFAHGDADCCIP